MAIVLQRCVAASLEAASPWGCRPQTWSCWAYPDGVGSCWIHQSSIIPWWCPKKEPPKPGPRRLLFFKVSELSFVPISEILWNIVIYCLIFCYFHICSYDPAFYVRGCIWAQTTMFHLWHDDVPSGFFSWVAILLHHSRFQGFFLELQLLVPRGKNRWCCCRTCWNFEHL